MTSDFKLADRKTDDFTHPPNAMTERSQAVLQFWFSNPTHADLTTMVRQFERWFRGGVDEGILEQFVPLFEQATKGELDDWSAEPRSRLALILILDQFSRTIHRGTAQAFAQDYKACALALQGLDNGHYAALKTPWEKTFFFLPLAHSEELANLELVVDLANDLVREAPSEHRALLEFSAGQADRHYDIIARFGRHPHRNDVLGRISTVEELDYLASGQLVHQRSLPVHLAHFLDNFK